jgi:hypothetical protein
MIAEVFKNGFLKQAELGEKKKGTYEKWKSLVNMTPESLSSFRETDHGSKAGLTRAEASAKGIRSGQDSAKAILRMKGKNPDQWSPADWQWAGKQVSFISRMRGNKGALYDPKGQPTRKLTSLKIWGHNPE